MAKNKKKGKNSEDYIDNTFNPKEDQLNIQINSFGEISSNYSIDEINEFLNKNTDDKKLKPKKKEKK